MVIICSESNQSLSSVLRIVQDVTRRKSLYFQSSGEITNLQPTDLRLKTKLNPFFQLSTETSLVVGTNILRLSLLKKLQLGKRS